MVEIILILSLAIIFIILLRKLPEVKLDSDSSIMSTVPTTATVPPVVTSVPASGGRIIELWKKAEAEFEKKNLSKAEKLYLKIAALDPKNPKIYGKLGIIYLEQKNYLDAREAFGEAVKRESNNALWYNNLGLVLYNLKRFSESVEAYKKSLAIDNSKAVRFFNLGLVYEAMGESQKALEAYERAASLEPENVEFQNLIIRIKEEIKKK